MDSIHLLTSILHSMHHFLISAHTLSHVLTAQTIVSLSLSLCHRIGLKDLVIFNGENNESSSSGARAVGPTWYNCSSVRLNRCLKQRCRIGDWVWCWIWLGCFSFDMVVFYFYLVWWWVGNTDGLMFVGGDLREKKKWNWRRMRWKKIFKKIWNKF